MQALVNVVQQGQALSYDPCLKFLVIIPLNLCFVSEGANKGACVGVLESDSRVVPPSTASMGQVLSRPGPLRLPWGTAGLSRVGVMPFES